jgi:hypothetical protein
MGLREIEWGDMDWSNLAQDRDQVVGSCKLDSEPLCFVKFWEIL